ncbi:MAG TPA: hypothetical protein VFW25_06400 [Silvibacterium sp.]|nr:hypothetical protein [Silvibacterium sp.]
MKINGNRWALACLGIAVITASAAFAQQQPSSSDSYQGVSQPPPDDTIIATPDTAPPAEQPAATAKPSAATYAAQPAVSAASPRSASIAAGRTADSKYDNTDYGVVTVPVSKEFQNEFHGPGVEPTLHLRENTDEDIVTPRPGPPNELAEGTEIHVRMDNALSTTDTTVGTPFQGRIIFNVMQNGRVAIPGGSTLRGRVVHVSQGHHFGPAATLRLRPDIVILPDGTAYHLHAQVYSSEANGTRTGSEGAIKPSAHALKKTAEYGVGVGTGAMVGAELGGPAGALAGSLAGAGVITTHLLLQHPEAAVVPAGSEVDFSLTEPLDLTPTRN